MAEIDGRADEALMLAVKTGAPEAFATLYNRHKNGVISFCARMLRDGEEAADIFQETFRYLFRHAATYEATAKFTTYLYRIARNLCIDVLRKRNRWNLQQLDTEVDVPDGAPAGRTRLESEEMDAQVRDAMRDVPEPFREVLLLRLTRGLPYEEIAEITEAPIGTVKSRLHTGFQILRKSLRRAH